MRAAKVNYAKEFDYILLLAALALVALGILLIYSGSLPSYGSASSVIEHPVARQIAFAMVGVAAMFGVSRVDYRLWGYAAKWLFVAALASLLFVLVIGQAVYGSRRWIELAGTPVQPSEMAKLLVVIVLAKYLADRQERMGSASVFVTSLVIALVPTALVFAEPDLGSAIILIAIWLAIVIMAGARATHVLGLIGSAAVAAPFALIAVMSNYQRERIATFLDPGKDPLGSGFNTLQAQISIGSGRLFGKGLTHGTQTQLDYLRTQTTDYIFSVLGEELGFVGVVILFALFIVLLMRCLQTAASSRDPFGRLLATGICTYILFQVFINVGVNIRLVPVTGIPLPFISQGGSSLLTLFIALGILESVRMHRGPPEW
ncbi:MAG: rod shape-determining protein RodA [Dehalococcoidia bacterium]|jgi:rod shape determining protein RodA